MKLRDTEPYSWHRLKAHPDRIDKAGPTAFEVARSKCPCEDCDVVCTRDGPGSPSYHVTGSQRTQAYLDTEIITDDD